MSETEALLISAAIEAPVAFLIVRALRWPCRGAGHAALAAAVATAVTHPQFWEAVFWLSPRIAYWPTVIALEILVVLVEGGLIAWMVGLPLRRALPVSLAANAASFAAGLFLNR